MKTSKMIVRTAIAAVLIFGLVGCASTKLVNDWTDPAFEGQPFEKIIVLALFKNDLQRRGYEQAFAERITSGGVVGIAGHTLMDDAKDYGNKPKIRQALDTSGADAVLLVNLVSVDKEERVVPPRVDYVPRYGYGHRYHGYYGMSYDRIYTPGYTKTDTIVKLETTVYDADTEKMVWAGGTRSFNPNSAKTVVKENADLITSSMEKAGLLP